MNNEHRRVARTLRDEVNARVAKRVVGRLDSAIVASTPSGGDATVAVLLDGGSVPVPARAARGALFTAGDRVLVWRAGSKLRILGHAAPVTAAHPFAAAAGTATVTMSSGAASGTVTYPAGRFTVRPLVDVWCEGGTPIHAQVTSYDGTTGFDFALTQIGGSSFSGSRTVSWSAVQMSSGSASG